ncbi:MFS transporter [soil metagenome]
MTALDVPGSLRMTRTFGFVYITAAIFLAMAASSAPSPLYRVYQEEFGFSAVMLTVIFAIYTLCLLIALLVTGSLSDCIGRRPVLIAGLGLLAVSMALFLFATGTAGLILARSIQGFATGTLLAALAASVIDLEPPGRTGFGATTNSVAPPLGMGFGAVIAALVIDASHSPADVIFFSLFVVFALMTLVALALPETSPKRGGWQRSLVPRLGVPASARAPFLQSIPALMASWSLGGLYLSLGPSLVSKVLDGSSHLEEGLVVICLAGAGASASFALRTRTPREITLFGTTALAVGTALTIVAIAAESLPGFFAATLIAGTGFGTSFLGVVRSLAHATGPAERGELFASMYVVSYLAFGVPAIIAGILTQVIGLRDTAMIYAVFVIVLATTAALARKFGSKD